jgi:hypothetical protein
MKDRCHYIFTFHDSTLELIASAGEFWPHQVNIVKTRVVFDFKDVPSIGQAFADEIFRVYAKKHPDIILLPANMDERVEYMVNRALNHEKN